jgi:hypothetical protein
VIGLFSHQVPDGRSPGGLFQGEVTEVGEEKGQLLPVIGAPADLPVVFHEEDA